jgi:hypothetical protein
MSENKKEEDMENNMILVYMTKKEKADFKLFCHSKGLQMSVYFKKIYEIDKEKNIIPLIFKKIEETDD